MKRIIVNKLSKKFNIGFKKRQTALSRLSNWHKHKELVALHDLSFEVSSGEIVGVIGKNGSGKSTLLRILADIYPQHDGSKDINGKVIPLIGLGQASAARLTMADNIYLVGALFGLDRKLIKKKFHQIVTFSELDEFVHTKLFQFSEGMKQRLAFSIAIHCNPDILLLDEVFEVGDQEFRNKSAAKIKELAKAGITVMLVSHELDMIRRNCDRVIWMEGGKIIKDDSTNEVLEGYLNSTIQKDEAPLY